MAGCVRTCFPYHDPLLPRFSYDCVLWRSPSFVARQSPSSSSSSASSSSPARSTTLPALPPLVPRPSTTTAQTTTRPRVVASPSPSPPATGASCARRCPLPGVATKPPGRRPNASALLRLSRRTPDARRQVPPRSDQRPGVLRLPPPNRCPPLPPSLLPRQSRLRLRMSEGGARPPASVGRDSRRCRTRGYGHGRR